MLRLKQAEHAMRLGRLDEALQHAIRPEFREHRRGKEIVGRLSKALVQRGQEHLNAARLRAAADDCQRAMKLATDDPRALALWDDVQAAFAEQARSERQESMAIREARKLLARGDWTIGKELVEPWLDSPQANELIGQMESQRREAESAVERARQALTRSAYDDALHWFAQLQRLRPQSDECQSLRRDLSQQLAGHLQSLFAQGRLDQSQRWYEKLRPMQGELGEELVDQLAMLTLLNEAMRHLREGRTQQAVSQLLRVQQRAAGQSWLNSAIATVRQLAAAQDAIEQGPLGLLELGHGTLPGKAAGVGMATTSLFPTHVEPTHGMCPADSLPPVRAELVRDDSMRRPFAMHVDGGGSIRVLPQPTITIRSASSSRTSDLRLLGMPADGHVRILRREGDYFFQTEQQVEINGRKVSDKLLADGDVLVLGRRCRIRFQLPVASSTTAVLTLEHTHLSDGHTRRVVLFDDAIVLGSGRNTHVTVNESRERAVLYWHRDRLMLRTGTAILPIWFDQAIVTDAVTMTLRPFGANA